MMGCHAWCDAAARSLGAMDGEACSLRSLATNALACFVVDLMQSFSSVVVLLKSEVGRYCGLRSSGRKESHTTASSSMHLPPKRLHTPTITISRTAGVTNDNCSRNAVHIISLGSAFSRSDVISCIYEQPRQLAQTSMCPTEQELSINWFSKIPPRKWSASSLSRWQVLLFQPVL